jgi:hypothetical protein
MFRRTFTRWGLPERVRVDNGHPWGSAGDLPTALALWLIGLGVGVIWNPPRQPWCNPKVERCNGVTQQWAEPRACADHATLERRLDWAACVQRQEYPSIRGRPRLEAYPQLLYAQRPYRVEDEPRLWDLSRVDAFLAEGAWYRRADRYGLISLYNRGRCLGRAHRGREVAIRFDREGRHWVASDLEGTVLVRWIAGELSRERIMNLEVGHRRPPRRKSKGAKPGCVSGAKPGCV